MKKQSSQRQKDKYLQKRNKKQSYQEESTFISRRGIHPASLNLINEDVEKYHISAILNYWCKEDHEAEDNYRVYSIEQADQFWKVNTLKIEDFVNLAKSMVGSLSFLQQNDIMLTQLGIDHYQIRQISKNDTHDQYLYKKIEFFLKQMEQPYSIQSLTDNLQARSNLNDMNFIQVSERQFLNKIQIKMPIRQEKAERSEYNQKSFEQQQSSIENWVSWVNWRRVLRILEKIIHRTQIEFVQSTQLLNKKLCYKFEKLGLLKILEKFVNISFDHYAPNILDLFIKQIKFYYDNPGYLELFKHFKQDNFSQYDENISELKGDTHLWIKSNDAFSKPFYLCNKLVELLTNQNYLNIIQNLENHAQICISSFQATMIYKNNNPLPQKYLKLISLYEHSCSFIRQKLEQIRKQKMINLVQMCRQRFISSKFMQFSTIIEHRQRELLWDEQQTRAIYEASGLCLFHQLPKKYYTFENHYPLRHFLCKKCILSPHWKDKILHCTTHCLQITVQRQRLGQQTLNCRNCFLEQDELTATSQICIRHKCDLSYACLCQTCKHNQQLFCLHCLQKDHLSHLSEVYNIKFEESNKIIERMHSGNYSQNASELIATFSHELSMGNRLEKVKEQHFENIKYIKQLLKNTFIFKQNQSIIAQNIIEISTKIKNGHLNVEEIQSSLQQMRQIVKFSKLTWIRQTEKVETIAEYLKDKLSLLSNHIFSSIAFQLQQFRAQSQRLITDLDIFEKAQEFLNKKYEILVNLQQPTRTKRLYNPCSIADVSEFNKQRIKKIIIDKVDEELQQQVQNLQIKSICSVQRDLFNKSKDIAINRKYRLHRKLVQYETQKIELDIQQTQQQLNNLLQQFDQNLTNQEIKLEWISFQKENNNIMAQFKWSRRIAELNQNKILYNSFLKKNRSKFVLKNIIKLLKFNIIQQKIINRSSLTDQCQIKQQNAKLIEEILSFKNFTQYQLNTKDNILQVISKKLSKSLDKAQILLLKQKVINKQILNQKLLDQHQRAMQLKNRIFGLQKDIVNKDNQLRKFNIKQQMKKLSQQNQLLIQKKCNKMRQLLRREWTKKLTSFEMLSSLNIRYLIRGAVDRYFYDDLTTSSIEQVSNLQRKHNFSRWSRISEVDLNTQKANYLDCMSEELLHMRVHFDCRSIYSQDLLRPKIQRQNQRKKEFSRHCKVVFNLQIYTINPNLGEPQPQLKDYELKLVLFKRSRQRMHQLASMTSRIISLTFWANIFKDNEPIQFIFAKLPLLRYLAFQICQGLQYGEIIKSVTTQLKGFTLRGGEKDAQRRYQLHFQPFYNLEALQLMDLSLSSLKLPQNTSLLRLSLHRLKLTEKLTIQIFHQIRNQPILSLQINMPVMMQLLLSLQTQQLIELIYLNNPTFDSTLTAIDQKWSNLRRLEISDHPNIFSVLSRTKFNSLLVFKYEGMEEMNEDILEFFIKKGWPFQKNHLFPFT